MSKHIHWVVSYNIETGQFAIDDDTLTANFHNGTWYNEETNEWSSPDGDEENELDANIGYLLGETLGLHNGNARRDYLTYIADDGNYGDASGLAIVDTSEWTEDDWARLDDEHDWNRPETARLIAEEKRKKGGTE